jgi:hypothetical protein
MPAMGTEPVYINSPYARVRRWPRLKINVPIRAIVQRETRILIIEGRGNELNEGGMAVYAGVELKVNDRCEVEFTPPYSGMPIRVRCTVRNRNGYHYGVEFQRENPDDEDKVTLIRQALQPVGSPVQ